MPKYQMRKTSLSGNEVVWCDISQWHGVTDLSHISANCNALSQTLSTPSTVLLMAKRTNPSLSWDEGDEEVLIKFIQGSIAIAGDGINFKQATWNAVAAHMAPFTTQGGVKMANACKNKFSQAFTFFFFLSLGLPC